MQFNTFTGSQKQGLVIAVQAAFRTCVQLFENTGFGNGVSDLEMNQVGSPYFQINRYYEAENHFDKTIAYSLKFVDYCPNCISSK